MTPPMPALDDVAQPALVLTGPGADPGGAATDAAWASVVLDVADEAELRLAVSALPPLGRARHVWCRLATAAAPLTPLLRPEWPPLARLVAETTAEGAVTRLSFRRPAPVAPVLAELARRAGTPVVSGHHGLVVDGLAVPADPGVVTPEVPASVGLDVPVDDLQVLGRPPVAVEAGPGPLDEALFNPVGFRRDWDRASVPLPPGPPSPALVRALRDAQAVVVGSDADPRTVAALAMAGIPLSGAGQNEVDLGDPDAREAHSVRLRRAALREHSALAWRIRVGAAAGVRTAAWPTAGDVEITLPDGLSHAAQVVDDLLLAHAYSGADRVTMPLEPGAASEHYGWVAGGPTLVAPSRTGLSYVTHGLALRGD